MRRFQIFQEENHASAVQPQISGGVGFQEDVLKGRVDLEINDYPGTSANERHVPKPIN